MAKTYSEMLPLGTTAPSFNLLCPTEDRQYSLEQLKGEKATMVGFWCNHCPFVKHIRDQLIKMGNEYHQKGVSFILINANDVAKYPDDSPAKMIEEALNFSYQNVKYLYDESQQTAKNYLAACTPDLYLFDQDLKCVYRGRFDGASPGNNITVTGDELKKAMDLTLEGKKIEFDQKPSMGCNIKWKD